MKTLAQHLPISICICTYNRCVQLDKTLASLVASKESLIQGDEILVIDNNSSDTTRAVALKYASQLPIRYLFEASQGLSAARNKALQEFVSEVIIFFDDDVTLSAACLGAYRTAISRYPDYDFFGGRIRVEWLTVAPLWLKSDDLVLLNGLFGIYAPADGDLQLNTNTLGPYGANFALRRNTVDQLGLFDTDLGVRGSSIARGEETEYFRRANNAGLAGMYLAAAEVGHRFQVERLTMAYLYRYGIEKGRAEVLLNQATSKRWLAPCSGFLIRGLWQLLKGRLDRFYQCVINIGIERGMFSESGKLARQRLVGDSGTKSP